MKRLRVISLLGAGVGVAGMYLAGFGGTASAATPPTRAVATTCVIVYPVWVDNQQLTDQYEVCLPVAV